MNPYQPRGLLAAAATAMLAAWPLAAGAEPQTVASAGLWAAYADTGPDQRPICGLSTTGADGRRIIVQQSAGETGLDVVLEKPSWAIPDQTSVDVVFQFDDRGPVSENATGNGTRLAVSMTFDRSVPFMRSLRLGSVIRVQFPNGNEPAWTGGLRGSSAMVDAFNECRMRFATMPASSGPTQPYVHASPSPAPTSPAPTSPAPISSAPTSPAPAPAAAPTSPTPLAPTTPKP